MKLIDDLKRLKLNRKGYRIKPTIEFYIDDKDYIFSFFPTIEWQPWVYRYLNCSVIDIWWLHFHILIGKWETLSCRNCKHEKECLENKRHKSFWDDIMAETRNCPDFET